MLALAKKLRYNSCRRYLPAFSLIAPRAFGGGDAVQVPAPFILERVMEIRLDGVEKSVRIYRERTATAEEREADPTRYKIAEWVTVQFGKDKPLVVVKRDWCER